MKETSSAAHDAQDAQAPGQAGSQTAAGQPTDSAQRAQRAQLAQRVLPDTARGHGVRWGDEWDDAPLDLLPVSRLAGLAARLITTYWWYTAEGTGLSAGGIGVLAALEEEDGLRSGEVAARSWVTAPMVSYLADVLEQNGYVRRRRDARDRRVVHLHITDKGRAKLRQAREHVAARWQMAFDYLDPADERAIRKFLRSTVDRFGELLDQEQ